LSLSIKHEDGDPTSFSKAIKHSAWDQTTAE